MNKTAHQFECRDDIWKRVEALAKRRGVSTDEIVQAALIQLFTRKKSPTAASEANTPAPAPPPGPPEPPGGRGAPPRPRSASAGRPTLPRPGSPARPSGPPSNAGTPGSGPSRLPPPGGRPSPPGTPPPSAASQPGEDRPLYLFFEGNWYTVDQEQFVIGRGSKFSDLPIKDANISRRHCAVVRRGGEYYIKDLGSTNGIEFAGERVDDHHVEEGNVYYLCDHELRFSFQAPY
ncbi:FHA domain-containing protein [Enhygromyxa salina]|uniref:Transcriptional regulatory protein EmbR n=1 Tax=Enhygromyxa salina TaxID=215803 RepID=A0A2S9Y1R7_9BACT|nr:FHA domain-containing protein [Enhygromyxa salina]PRP99044.1 Transcriptional regulatory protein EmbR [Enhygromyxa salina]